MFTNCLAKQEEIQKKFSKLSTNEKYLYIMELGKSLPKYPEELRKEEYIISGCQSTLYLYSTCIDGVMHFQADSDALISKGLAALLILVFDKELAEVVIKCEPTFLQKIEIFSTISQSRSNGLKSLFTKMQQDSLQALIKSS